MCVYAWLECSSTPHKALHSEDLTQLELSSFIILISTPTAVCVTSDTSHNLCLQEAVSVLFILFRVDTGS